MIVYTSQTPWRKSFTVLRPLTTSIRQQEECKDTQTLIKLDSWVCSYDYVLPCLFPLLSRPYWSIGKSPGACPPEEATISVWMRGYRTVVWKSRRAWLMESSGYAVISLWLSSPQIYSLLISASPTLMESQARSFELSDIFMCSLSISNNRTYTTRGWNSSHTNYLFFFSDFQSLLCNISLR